MSSLLIVCASMKPAHGEQARSAVRNLCAFVHREIALVLPDVETADLRDDPVPPFDGRAPDRHDSAAVREWLARVHSARSILLGVPAYWGAPSGVAKNWIDVLAGPAYDLAGRRTVFGGKMLACFVVGADAISASEGASDMARILEAVGARLVNAPLEIVNPRVGEADWKIVGQQLLLSAASAAKGGLYG